MFTRYKLWATVLLSAIFTSVLIACGGGGSSASSRNYLGTQSPGDVWSISISDNLFTATNKTLNFSVSGTVQVLSSGYKKLEVTTLSPEAVGKVTIGTIGYAVEVPDTAVIVQIENKFPIIASAVSVCPTQTNTFNFVTVPDLNWTTASRAYGTVVARLTGTDLAFELSKKKIDGSTYQNQTSSGWTCTNGIFTNSVETISTINASATGVFVADDGPNMGGSMGVLQMLVDENMLKNKEFVGTRWITNETKDAGVISGSIDASGTALTPSEINPLTGEKIAGDPITLDYTNASTGMIEAAFPSTIECPSRPLRLMISQIAGKFFMLGIGLDQQCKPYNLAVIEK